MSEFANEYVEVTFTAIIRTYNFQNSNQVQLTYPVGIYTYADTSYLQLADKDDQSTST